MSADQDGSFVQSGLPACLYDLEADLSVAVRMENYQKAASLRDELNEKREQDGVASALVQLREAVASQDFENAKELQQRLRTAVSERSRSSSRGPEFAVNRLLVLTAEGKLLTCRPDGGSIVNLGEQIADGAKVQFFQPTWSPSGDLIAVTMLDLDKVQATSAMESQVVCVWAQDASSLLKVDAPFVPFYFYWSHDSARLSYLTTYNDGPGTAVSLDMVQVLDEAPEGPEWSPLKEGKMMHIEEGVPLFYDLCAHDRRLLLHIGSKRKVAVQEPAALDAPELVLSSRPGDFRAPLWLPSPAGAKQLVLLVEKSSDGRQQHIVLADAKGGSGPLARRALVEVHGFVSMAATDDGQRVAVLGRAEPQGREQLYIMQGPFDLEPDPWPTDLEPLAMAQPDLLAEKRRTVGMFWSPDGHKLLALTTPNREDLLTGKAQAGEGIRWEVTDVRTRRTVAFESFVPSAATLSSFLPFFDQYAISQSLWAPDSESFCYAGTGVDGEEGAWVQRLPARGQTAGPPPELVVAGVQLVSWSPC